MSRSFDPDDLTAVGETFAEDLRSAFPEVELPERVVRDHVATMISAAQLLAEEGAIVLEPASHPRPEGLTTPRRRWMRTKLIRRVVAVAAGLLLSLSGLAFAGAFEGSDDPGNDDTTAIVSHQTDDHQGEDGDDQGEDENADDQGENSDDQGEDADDQGEDENADDQGEDGENQGEDENADDQGENSDDQGEDGDDQGEDENADDQGENRDDQGEDENADDQGENNDDQGEDADDQGDNDNTNDDQGANENVDDDQGGGGDSQD
jgi:hypothetical protein